MARILILIAVLVLGAGCAGAPGRIHTPLPGKKVIILQNLPYGSYAGMKAALETAASIEDDAARSAALDEVIGTLQEAGAIPYASNDSVAFLYRGPAEHVSFAGDFNGWDAESVGAQRIGTSDLWIHEEFFPLDARLDYKVVADGTWRLDPLNPRIQRSGFGDNSELRMPAYAPSPWVTPRKHVSPGSLTAGNLFSERLGFALDYQVYTPAGYDDLDTLPVMYVTDGHEYADNRLGAMVTVMDNLIHDGRLRPIIAVFIDMRVNGANERGDMLEVLYAATIAALSSDEMTFAPLLPDDDVDLGERVGALAGWCQGYLYGLPGRAHFTHSAPLGPL